MRAKPARGSVSGLNQGHDRAFPLQTSSEMQKGVSDVLFSTNNCLVLSSSRMVYHVDHDHEVKAELGREPTGPVLGV